MALTAKQAAFAREYLVDLNATQAAVRAGYSKRTADRQGHRLLKNAEISALVSELQRARAEKVEITADEVLRELKRLALVDIGEAFLKDGRLKPLEEMSVDVRRSISSIEYEEIFEGRGDEREQVGVLTKVKFWDKKGSLDSLGRHLKLFVDRVEHSADASFADLLKQARERAQRR